MNRSWYFLLLIIPVAVAGNNIRAGGDFLPAFVAGLIPVLAIVLVVELVALAGRALRRGRTPTTH